MNNIFYQDEKLYRAVFPESYIKMFWKSNGRISSAAFSDSKGLSVERGYYRDDKTVVSEMQKYFSGCIISVTVSDCNNVNAVIKYKPTKRSIYHSEIHGSEDKALLNKSQRRKLAEVSKIEYYEK